MLIDLLSTNYLVSFNIKVAEVVGLHAAIYLNEVMNINCKAIRKDKVDNGFITVDRVYLTSRTTLPESEQIDIETNLNKIGILEKNDLGLIKLNIELLASLIMSENEKLIDDVQSAIKLPKDKKAIKKASNAKMVKAYIKTVNPELRTAWNQWVDAVVEKFGYINKTTLEIAEQDVDKFANHDLDIALTIVKLATSHFYRDMTWAINIYNSQYKVSQSEVTTTVNNKVDVNMNTVF